jgi:N-acyl-L-homoserine lactone synthetase
MIVSPQNCGEIFMIKIITSANRAEYVKEISAMFADRKIVFVDILKWQLAVTSEGFEIDQFDDEHAIYLLASDDDGNHLGSMRLLRTDRPHILGSHFPHLSDLPVPAGPDTLEVTRLCLSPRLRAAERRLVRNRLISAMTDHALSRGITTLTGVARTSWLDQILHMGWRCVALGSPKPVDGVPTGAFRIDLDPDTPAELTKTGIYLAGTSAAFEARLNRFRALQDERPMFVARADASGKTFAAEQLAAEGYCVIDDLIPFETIMALSQQLDERFAATPFSEGGFYGPRTKRFGSLLKRSAIAAQLVQHPVILALAEKVLGPWCDRFNLNLTQGIEIHPGAPAQFPHRDQDMWQGEKGRIEYLINVIWPLSDFTAENGATRIWPGSHHAGAQDMPPIEKPVVAEMSPGAALVFLGSTLHAAGANYARSARRGLIISYCLGWLKPFENQWLCYPPAVARSFSPELADLIGYCQHRPNLGNYEGRSPSILLNADVPEHIAAADALRPDQQAQLEAFIAAQAQGHA